jgi:hypothetical protein
MERQTMNKHSKRKTMCARLLVVTVAFALTGCFYYTGHNSGGGSDSILKTLETIGTIITEPFTREYVMPETEQEKRERAERDAREEEETKKRVVAIKAGDIAASEVCILDIIRYSGTRCGGETIRAAEQVIAAYRDATELQKQFVLLAAYDYLTYWLNPEWALKYLLKGKEKRAQIEPYIKETVRLGQSPELWHYIKQYFPAGKEHEAYSFHLQAGTALRYMVSFEHASRVIATGNPDLPVNCDLSAQRKLIAQTDWRNSSPDEWCESITRQILRIPNLFWFVHRFKTSETASIAVSERCLLHDYSDEFRCDGDANDAAERVIAAYRNTTDPQKLFVLSLAYVRLAHSLDPENALRHLQEGQEKRARIESYYKEAMRLWQLPALRYYIEPYFSSGEDASMMMRINAGHALKFISLLEHASQVMATGNLDLPANCDLTAYQQLIARIPRLKTPDRICWEATLRIQFYKNLWLEQNKAVNAVR